MPTILDLPSDIIRLIASEELDHISLLRLELVSRRFHQILSSSKDVWWRLVERFLTVKRLPQLKEKPDHPRKIVSDFFRDDCDITSCCSQGYEIALQDLLSIDDDLDVYEIQEAVLHGHQDIYEYLRGLGLPIDNTLKFAAKSGNVTLFQHVYELYMEDPDLDPTDFTEELENSLEMAAQKEDNYAMIETIIPLVTTSENADPITDAISHGCIGNLRFLHEKGFPLHNTAFRHAINLSLEMVQILVEDYHCDPKDDLNLFDDYQVSCQSETNHVGKQILQYLIEKGAPTASSITLLARIVRSPDYDYNFVEYLIEKGVNINGGMYTRPLHTLLRYMTVTCQADQVEEERTLRIIQLLVKRGADLTNLKLEDTTKRIRGYLQTILQERGIPEHSLAFRMQCKGTTQKGELCKRKVSSDSNGYCHQHQKQLEQ